MESGQIIDPLEMRNRFCDPPHLGMTKRVNKMRARPNQVYFLSPPSLTGWPTGLRACPHLWWEK